MAPQVVSLGEILVEIMRKEKDVPHTVPGIYVGPLPSGAPVIFVDAVSRLGVSAGFIGIVGKDDFGKMLLDRLKSDRVDISQIRVLDDYTTGIAFNMYFSNGERRFVFHLRYSAAGQLSPNDIDDEYIARSKVLHVMGSSIAVSKTSMEAVYKAVEIAYENDLIISFDPNLRPELLSVEKIREICKPVLKKSRIVLPSGGEAYTLTGEKDLLEAGKKLLKEGVEIVGIKNGSKGSLIFSEDSILNVPAFKVEEVDPTGAGDMYDAAFIVGYMKKWPLLKIGEFANAVGAIKVTKFGPMEGPKNIDEVYNFIKERRGVF